MPRKQASTPKKAPVSVPKMDAPKTPKVKSTIGTEYKADANRPRAKSKK